MLSTGLTKKSLSSLGVTVGGSPSILVRVTKMVLTLQLHEQKKMHLQELIKPFINMHS